MKTLSVAPVALLPLLTSGAALAQSGHMMNGGFWNGGWMGGYGGIWMPALLVIVVVGLVAWVVTQNKK